MTLIQRAATLSILCLTGAVMHTAAAASAKEFDSGKPLRENRSA
jgi:hypothetical protein